MNLTPLVICVVSVSLLASGAEAAQPTYTLLAPVQVLPASPGSASTIEFSYALTGDTSLPRFAVPTQTTIVGNAIVIDVSLEADPGGSFPIQEMLDVGPLAEGTYAWVLRVHDLDNFEIDVEVSGEILVLDDPGTSGVFSLVMDARQVEVTDGSCTTIPCGGPTVVSDAPSTEFETFLGQVSLLGWNSTLLSVIESGEDWVTFRTQAYTDGFASPGTGRAVFDVAFRVTQALPYSITGDFEVDLPQLGNGITRFELRRVLDGQSFESVFGFTLEGPFEELVVNETGTLEPGVYQILATGAGCCGGADADWDFEATIGTPPPTPVPSMSSPALTLVAAMLGTIGLTAACRRW